MLNASKINPKNNNNKMISKRFIVFFYWFFLLNEDENLVFRLVDFNNDFDSKYFFSLEEKKYLKRIVSERKKEVILNIECHLEKDWSFNRFSCLEKSIVFFCSHEIIYNNNIKNNYCSLFIDQSIRFSKSYLRENDYKYVNKILDSILKKGNKK